MHARDASGRRVSLLNDDVASHGRYQASYCMSGSAAQQAYYSSSARSASSSPHTPELLRSDSYDSQMSTEPISPMTPLYDYGRGYNIPTSYEDYTDHTQAYAGTKRPSSYSDSRSASYDDDASVNPAGTDRSAKRYPCRFRESHHCEKTFTTSGHASRHSKIHTAEKAVPCTFPGCLKKFTRADNMKQHLDTHYKDKRSSSSRPSLSSNDRLSSTKSSSRSKVTPLPSPADAFDMSILSYPLTSRPSAARTHSTGLDALAAIACQEGA